MEQLTRKLKQGIKNWSVRQGFNLEDRRLVVAVSGGSDSVAMLALFSELVPELNLRLDALHINHGIREEADRDEEFVEKLTQDMQIPLIKRKINLGQTSIEEHARHKRYDIYREIGELLSADILLAHTSNDQVETVLFNMFRGTGPRGLYGMPVLRELSPDVSIFRPLMFATRRMLESYLKYRNISWRQDYTNYDINFSRNYIRYNVIPNLLARFGENSLRKVTETTDLQRELVGLFEERVERLYINLPYNIYAIPCNLLQRKNMLMFGEALRQILSHLDAPLSRFNNDLVRRILDTLESRTIDLFEDFRCEFFRGFLFVYRDSLLPHIQHRLEARLGRHSVPSYGDLIISPGGENRDSLTHDGMGFASLKISSSSRLHIANPSSGETFHPFKSSERRFTQFARDKKIPRFLRPSLPVLYIDDKPAWTMGAGISNNHSVSQDDSLYIHASLKGPWIDLIENFRHYL